MAKTIKGTNRADRIEQNGRPELTIYALGGNDIVILNRDDDLGGDNFVDAGKGNDSVVNTFEGGNRILMGAGNDTYVGTGFSFFNTFDVVNGGSGNDRFFVQTLLSTYIGGTGKDTFFTNGHKNNFDGGAGNDTISYQFRHEDSAVGNEGVTVDLNVQAATTGSNSREDFRSIENATGSLNADLIIGSNGKNVLIGLDGSDELQGKRGNDILVGGLGEDVLFGEAGADLFVFQTVRDSQIGSADVIADFSRAAGDRIDLSGIDADADAQGNQRFQFIGAASFSGAAGEARFANGVLMVDTDGNRIANMAVEVQNITAMQASDFIL